MLPTKRRVFAYDANRQKCLSRCSFRLIWARSTSVRAMSVKPAEILLSPYTLGDLKLKNRIVMAPLRSPHAGGEPGKGSNDLMAEYYTQRTGAGLIIHKGHFCQ